MKDTFLEILTLLLALAQNPKANEDEAAKVQGFITDAVQFAETAHGDSELNDPAIKDKINDLAIVLGSSEPDPEHAEVPEFEEGEAAPETEAEAEPEATEEPAAEEEEPEPEPEPVKVAPKKILTIKEKREMAEKAALASKPAPPKSGLKKK